MGQISLSLMLLSAAGLFIRSSIQAARVEPGFRVSGEILAEVDASLAGYNETRGRETYRAVVERLQAIPGIESVSFAATVPFGMVTLDRTVQRSSDAPSSAAGSASASHEVVCQYNCGRWRLFPDDGDSIAARAARSQRRTGRHTFRGHP